MGSLRRLRSRVLSLKTAAASEGFPERDSSDGRVEARSFGRAQMGATSRHPAARLPERRLRGREAER
jgi:hypothetical protein